MHDQKKTIIIIGGQRAAITVESDMKMFMGEFLDLNGGADFYGKNILELIAEGERSLFIFMDECRKDNISPTR